MDATQIIEAERAHLATSRAALAAMREASADWTKAVGGDSVSTQYLKQMLYRRVEALADNPDTPLFFGRLNYRQALGAELDEDLHIGRRHVTSEIGGDPLIVDWRAPLSLPFYRARSGDPMGVELRRRFGFAGGVLTAFEDEDLASGSTTQTSALLEAEIERPRSGPMRDIVATIQPDQDVLVRADLDQSLCIQGAPGTGKTAVGLHRAAFLLYTYRERLSRSGVLVVGPNDSFLSYIGDVLPALGEIAAEQQTITSLVEASTGLQVKGTDPDDVASIKGDARMAEVVRRAIWGHLTDAAEMLVVPIGARQWRVPAHEVAAAVQGLVDRGVRYEAGRAMVTQRLAHLVLLRMEAAGITTDDRVQNQVARTKPVKEAAVALWPTVKAPALAHRLLTDANFLADCAEGVLTAEEQATLLARKPARSAASMAWTPADLVIVDEITDQLLRTPSLGHVIIDEAQDLSPMQLRAAGRRATTGSVTLLGDIAQGTTPWATADWATTLTHLGKPDADITELTEGFRVPGDVIDFAARLLPHVAPQLSTPHSIRRNRGDLTITRTDDLAASLIDEVTDLLAREGTVGVIVADAAVDDVVATLRNVGLAPGELEADERAGRLEVIAATLAKGLEFDHVLLVEPAAIVGEQRAVGLRRLYVALTRAVSTLRIVHADDLPAELTR